jgi:hypothetical protein
LREDQSSRKPRSSSEGDGLGPRPGNRGWPVGTRSRRGLPSARAAPAQAPTSQPGPRGPVRPRGAWCRPSRDAATAFISGRRPRRLWTAAERAISPQAKVGPTARRDRAARWRSACLPRCRRPRRPRRQLKPRTRPGAGVLLRRGETKGGSSLVGRRPPRIGPAGKPPGTALSRGGRTWRLPVMRFVRTTGGILRTQLPASVASCQRSFRAGAAGPRPLRRTAAWRTASWRTAAWQPPRGVLRNTTEVERGSAAPALRTSDLPHRPGAAESARSSITVIGKVRRGPLQREAGTRKGALRGPPGIGARIGGWPEPSSPIEQGPGELPLVSDVRQIHCLLQRPLPGRTVNAGAREEGPP